MTVPFVAPRPASHPDRAPHLAPLAVDLAPLLTARAAVCTRATGRTVARTVDADLPRAHADPAALAAVVDHLLDNAVRYSPPDEPVVLSAFGEAHWVRVHVTDAGTGFPGGSSSCGPAPAGRAATRQGGLAAVRVLVEAMSGRVHVHTERGLGTTFVVALPRADRAVPVNRAW